MDLFNTKALADANQRILALECKLSQTQDDLALFKYALRKMDETTTQLSQIANANNCNLSIGKLIGELVKQSEHRRKSESDRINALITNELARGDI